MCTALDGLFEDHLSTDKVQAYKPDPRAYQMALEAFRLQREEIALGSRGRAPETPAQNVLLHFLSAAKVGTICPQVLPPGS